MFLKYAAIITVPQYISNLAFKCLMQGAIKCDNYYEAYWHFCRELLCVWFVCKTSGLHDIEQPQLSPLQYKLSGKQHLLDRTRVLVREH